MSLRRMEYLLATATAVVLVLVVVCVSLLLAAPADARYAGVVAASHSPRDDCHSRACRERVARKQCSQARVVPCVRRAAMHYRVSLSMLLRKARCESRLNPLAANGVHAGLFQFRIAAPSTWATTPYAKRSPWRAKWASLAAAWMHRVGRGGEWSCR